MEPTPITTTEPTVADIERALFGADKTPRIVAVETRDEVAVVLRREKNSDDVTQTEVPFRPWLCLRERRELPQSVETVVLKGGSNGHPYLVRFANRRAFHEARRILRDEQRRDIATYPNQIKNFLVGSGLTLFKGMTFNEVRRMQLDIETNELSFNARGAKILLIVASDNSGREAVLCGDEREMLQELTQIFHGWNPDVIEGHNIYAFDLPWLDARAKANNVSLTWGRDNSPIQFGQERACAIGANNRPFVPCYIWGRHVVDTYLSVQRFDLARGEIGAYGLKECARHYKIAEPDRVYVDRADLARLFRDDYERVRDYALGDVRETRRLAEIVTPTEFYQTRMIPDSYQNVSVTGSGEKTNSLLVRAYLQNDTAIPRSQVSTPYSGGYTELRRAGLIRNVVKADVESLYPSIMLSQNIAPATDTLNLFLPLLRELTNRRFEAKARAKAAPDGLQHEYWDGLQGSYKLLINSFYGYLGAPFYFNDYAAAARITEVGQDLVKRIAGELERRGASVIEIDTDGVYFQAPTGVHSQAEEETFVKEIGAASLPDGIRLAFDGRFAVMLSLKAKNYVLIGHDGKKTFKGSSLRSRADEKFGREFTNAAIDRMLADDRDGLARLYADTMGKIERRALGTEQIARRERVTENTFKSEARRRNAQAMSGLKVGDYASLYQRENDKALVPIADYDGDEDVEHYRQKLYKFAERLRVALGDDFAHVFPKPLTVAERKTAERAAQQMNLFDL